MNKEKLVTCMQQRIDNLNEKINKSDSHGINQLSNRLFELENWLDKIENGDFD